MKKVWAILLILSLLSLASATCFAADTITSNSGSASADVKGTYVAGGPSATVYSVDIAWGSMEFTYTGASGGTWNPATHQYGGGSANAWSCATDANKITVTNHSNAAVNAQFSYVSASGYEGISGTFSQNELNLATAVDTAVSNAPSGSVTLSLTGDLPSNTNANTTIGTVTVTLEE